MKRELFAGLLLLLLIAGSLWNLRCADALTQNVADSLSRAEEAARRQEYAEALQALEKAQRDWDAKRSYTQVFFRQPDLDSLQDAFADLGQLLLQKDEAWPAALRRLRYHLEMVDRMEHLSAGTVFSRISLSFRISR